MKQKIVLIGGVYGSGKTYISRLIAHHPGNPYITAIVDQDDLPGVVDQQGSDSHRVWVWEEGFINEIQKNIAEGHDLVLAPGTFKTRKVRDKYLYDIERATLVDVIPLFYMLPMKDTISAVKARRRGDTSLVNNQSVHGEYSKFNRHFRSDDNTDLLLPSDRRMLAPEYLALLSHWDRKIDEYANENSVHLLGSPRKNEDNPQRRWVVLTQHFEPNHLYDLIKKDIKDPLQIREHLETHLLRPSTEGA